MNRIFIPSNYLKDWRLLLTKPKTQWKRRFSARALAYCWVEAKGFPKSVNNVFKKSELVLFQNIKLLLIFPEYKIPLPPYRSRPSQTDIFILAKGNEQLISITVEGKVSEHFGKIIAKWNNSEGKQERLDFLLNVLELRNNEDVGSIRYQLLHRTASAIIEAEKFNAKNALMFIHSFSQCYEHFNDYKRFLALFKLNAKPDSLVFAKNINGIDLYFCWIRGDKKYLYK